MRGDFWLATVARRCTNFSLVSHCLRTQLLEHQFSVFVCGTYNFDFVVVAFIFVMCVYSCSRLPRKCRKRVAVCFWCMNLLFSVVVIVFFFCCMQ